MQVYRQRCHSRALLIARSLSVARYGVAYTFNFDGFTLVVLRFTSCLPYSIDYSTEVPPLPFRTEVKLSHADGTGATSGRVGSRFSPEEETLVQPFIF